MISHCPAIFKKLPDKLIRCKVLVLKRVARWSRQKYSMQYLGHICTKKLFSVYPKLKFNGASGLLSGHLVLKFWYLKTSQFYIFLQILGNQAKVRLEKCWGYCLNSSLHFGHKDRKFPLPLWMSLGHHDMQSTSPVLTDNSEAMMPLFIAPSISQTFLLD